MTKAKHTPIPWKIDGMDILDQDGAQIATTSYADYLPVYEEENAAHIVKCVNMHDELVEALERAVVYMKEEFNNIDDTGEEFSIVEQIEKALKKAGAL